MEGSILESIGTELIGVMSPVSICMLLVVLLVYTLSPPPSLSSISPSPTTSMVTAANLVYSENPADSPTQKLEGAFLNAAVFILVIAAVTFLLVLLLYYNFSSFLKNYMRFSAFLILATMGGAIFLSLIRHFSLPLDAPTFVLSLLNFSAVGIVSVFGKGVPIIVTQCYTVALGIITAAWFTQLPEWTTWVLLVALAVYDLVAVLAPGGPLKILVELSQSRDEDLPALVYEARPTVSGRSRGGFGMLLNLSRNGGQNQSREVSVDVGVGDSEIVHIGENDDSGRGETSPLVPISGLNPREIDVVEEERSTLVETLERGARGGGAEERDEEDDPENAMNRGIKLGLGDFVFYSVLVGRAAMYDLMTVYAC
ncbi:hypothetical protein Cgig2_028184 [Carnegiea gigantea]|uniref:Presenilin n=1 Tax=Carnegiea gigantea TaxID=171969 RepID=A0A9Q1JMT3_9CARY|nr:hypothetical protein Cgig2_028184 [Carnegiea gigantea]